MATVTGYTAERMQAIEDAAIVDGNIVGNDLILVRHDLTEINAGSVIGPQGIQGPAGGVVVVTSTTRPTGGALFTGLLIYETDTKLIYLWDGAAWSYRGGAIICTSTTRPSAPIEGLPIYETDTDRHLIYNGFRFDPAWNMPWGFLGEANPTGADQGGIGTTFTNVTGASVALTNLRANRKNKITATMQAKSSTAGDLIIGYITDGANNILKRFYQNLQEGTTISEQQSGFVTHSPPAGAFTYKLMVVGTVVGATTVLRAATEYAPSILVEDIGPAGVPA